MNRELYAALISIAIAAAGYVVSAIQSKKLKEKITSLEEFINSSDAEYYIECPNCKQKIVLNKVKILINKQNKNKE